MPSAGEMKLQFYTSSLQGAGQGFGALRTWVILPGCL